MYLNTGTCSDIEMFILFLYEIIFSSNTIRSIIFIFDALRVFVTTSVSRNDTYTSTGCGALHLEYSSNPFSSTLSKKRLGGGAASARGKGAPKIVSDSPGTDDEGKFPKRFPRRNEPNSLERSFHGELDSKAVVTAGVEMNISSRWLSFVVLQVRVADKMVYSKIRESGRPFPARGEKTSFSPVVQGRSASRNRPLGRFQSETTRSQEFTVPDVSSNIQARVRPRECPSSRRTIDFLHETGESLMAESRDARDDRSP